MWHCVFYAVCHSFNSHSHTLTCLSCFRTQTRRKVTCWVEKTIRLAASDRFCLVTKCSTFIAPWIAWRQRYLKYSHDILVHILKKNFKKGFAKCRNANLVRKSKKKYSLFNILNYKSKKTLILSIIQRNHFDNLARQHKNSRQNTVVSHLLTCIIVPVQRIQCNPEWHSLSRCMICSRMWPSLLLSGPASWWNYGKERQFFCERERRNVKQTQ